MNKKQLIISIVIFILFFLRYGSAIAETGKIIPSDIQKALDNLNDDDLQFNCVEAAKYLYGRREGIIDILVSSLPILDWQGQDVILKILTDTKAYNPDESAVRLMLERLNDEQGPGICYPHKIYHYDYILYIEKYVERFKILLRSYIKAGNIRQLWIITHILAKKGPLDEMKYCYTSEVMNFVISNLRKDNIVKNASYAARICFLNRKISTPYLKQEIEIGDSQSKEISQILIELFSGQRHTDRLGYVDGLSYTLGVSLNSTYLDRIEHEGATSLIYFYLMKTVPDKPKFLTRGEYTRRKER